MGGERMGKGRKIGFDRKDQLESKKPWDRPRLR